MSKHLDGIEGLSSIETINTGNTISLETSGCNYCNMSVGSTANNNISYSLSNIILGGKAQILINTPSQPTVGNGAILITGSAFVANIDMYLYVENKGGRIDYYFLVL